MGAFWAISDKLLGLLYPASIYCMSCGNIIDGSRCYSLCDGCAGGLEWAKEGNSCRSCGKLMPLKRGRGGLCDSCQEWPPAFHRGFACAEYGGVRGMVHKLKYGGKTYMAEAISEIMFDRVFGQLPETDLVLPVPMHRAKEKRRGYNQADLLGRLLARKLRLPYDGGALARSRPTQAMSGLGSQARAENVKNAFAAVPGRAASLKGKRILLVDDVYTTGSTINECAEALKAAGAGPVSFVVFATGTDNAHGE